jgi:peptide/nickel transport system substrate-binding protein
VLAAIYDAPYDIINYEYKPAILEQIPSVSEGGAQISPLPVSTGDEVVDAQGNLTRLETGSRVRPAGCRDGSCVIAYDGQSPLSMDQMFVEFKMNPELLWSDGTPVTADDSVFAYEIAKDEATPGSKYVFDRTQSYEAADDATVQWWGKPGFVDPTYNTNFWTPLPKRIWEQLTPEELLTSDLSARTPMGFGPYVIKEWNEDTLRLVKNPYYYRSAEGLPKFSELIFRIVPDTDTAMTALIEGRCDLIDSTVSLDSQVSLLREMDARGQARFFSGQTPTMEWLTFGIVHSSYDDGANDIDRPDFFRDPRMRQAVAYCIDRQSIVDNVLFGLAPVPDTFVSSDHPLHASDLTPYPYDPAKGMQILDTIGWRDHDNDPSTPRHAQGVPRVAQSAELKFNYYTSSSNQRRQIGEIFAQSLRGCGIGVELLHVSQLELYAEGPLGPLFGRNFDLAEYAMATLDFQPACMRFSSSEVPMEANHWVGTNLSGYQNPTFDAACAFARQSTPDESAYADNYRLTQTIFAQDLPAIPLFNRIETAATRPDFCNFSLDPTAATDLYAIELFDYGDSCLP